MLLNIKNTIINCVVLYNIILLAAMFDIKNLESFTNY